VIGPTAARNWLREVQQPLRLRYRFAHCRAFDGGSEAPARAWLLGVTGVFFACRDPL
jgi:hypothetical protein